jgi:hypothetical protein
MVAAAQAARAAGHVPHHAQMRSRARFLEAAGARRPERQWAAVLGGRLRRGLSTAIALAAGFALGTAGLYYASASTLPGDTLYGIKRGFETVRLQLAADPSQRFDLERSFEARRTEELQAVLAKDRAVTVTFGGVLTARAETAWHVGGFEVTVTAETEVIGNPQPGFYVAVVAENRGGTLTARELRAEEFEIIGVLARVGEQWAINGTSFVVGRETVVSGSLAPGVTAAARIRVLHTGERVAVSLATRAATASPTPTRTPSATASPSPTARPPTQTPRPTVTRLPVTPTAQPATSAPQAPAQQPALTPSEDGDEDGDDDGGNSGPGGGEGEEEAGDDNSGPGGGDDDDEEDGGDGNSGSGDGDDGEDNSGSGGDEDDD